VSRMGRLSRRCSETRRLGALRCRLLGRRGGRGREVRGGRLDKIGRIDRCDMNEGDEDEVKRNRGLEETYGPACSIASHVTMNLTMKS